MRIIGIDPGLGGAIAILEDKKVLDLFEMPVMAEGKKNKKQLNSAQLVSIIKEKYDDVGIIAGVATAGIPQGALVAENLNLPFAYVRSKPKSHGMKNMIEGRIEKGKRVLLIEDLISTGGSSIKSVEAVRETGSIVIGVLSIFNYGFKVSEENFKNINCDTSSIFNYNDLLSIALKNNYIKDQDLEKLKSWRDNPEKWK